MNQYIVRFVVKGLIKDCPKIDNSNKGEVHMLIETLEQLASGLQMDLDDYLNR